LTFFLDEDHENKELSIPEEVSEDTATTVLHLVQYFAQQRVVINKVLFCLALQDRCASWGLSTITIPSERKHAHIFYNIFNIKSNIQKQSRRVYTITYIQSLLLQCLTIVCCFRGGPLQKWWGRGHMKTKDKKKFLHKQTAGVTRNSWFAKYLIWL
jgi:hypothetical protein